MAAISSIDAQPFVTKDPRTGRGKLALSVGKHFKLEHGEGKGLVLGPSEQATLFKVVGNPYVSCEILLVGDETFGVEINFRKEEVGNGLCIWSVSFTSFLRAMSLASELTHGFATGTVGVGSVGIKRRQRAKLETLPFTEATHP